MLFVIIYIDDRKTCSKRSDEQGWCFRYTIWRSKSQVSITDIDLNALTFNTESVCNFFRIDLTFRMVSSDQRKVIGNHGDQRNWATHCSAWHSDTIWSHECGATLSHVMACCLAAPGHFLKQCWICHQSCVVAFTQQVFHKKYFKTDV